MSTSYERCEAIRSALVHARKIISRDAVNSQPSALLAVIEAIAAEVTSAQLPPEEAP